MDKKILDYTSQFGDYSSFEWLFEIVNGERTIRKKKYH